MAFAVWPDRIVGRTGGNRRMGTVWETDDEIRIGATAEADDLNLLATKRMSGMSNGDY